MRNFRPAFTLVETLIAMAIIGVIAAITIPQVVKNMNKNQSAIVLARAVEQINLGCQNIIQTANDNSEDFSVHDRLSTIIGSDLGDNSENSNLRIMQTRDSFYFKNNLAETFWGLTPRSLEMNLTPRNFDGTTYEGTPITNRIITCIENNETSVLCRNFKDIPASINFVSDTTNDGLNANNQVSSNIPRTQITIDTNTFAKGPNTIGKDLFIFSLQNSGKLIPAEEYTRQIVRDGYKIKYY